MNCGWVKMYRKFSEWEWYRTPHMAHLFIHLVISANHEKTKWQGVDIMPGQFVTGLHSLSAATGITIQTLRTCLRRLETGGEISRKSTNKFTIITVCKYNDYQTENNTTNKQLTSNQQTTNNKQEVKNERIKEKDIVVQDKKPARPRQAFPFQEIVEYLNERSGKEFNPTTKATRQHISARCNEGFSLSDFQAVIDYKVSEWGTEPEMMQYIRPQTLFGTKFESYLQAAKLAGYSGETSRPNIIMPEYVPPLNGAGRPC